MIYHRWVVIIFFTIVTINAQSDLQFHITGGFVSPFNSTRGASVIGKVQYNYNEKFSTYLSSGYLSYGQYYLIYQIDHENKKISDESDHEVVPILLGGRYTAVNSTSWHPFIEVELGLSIFNYTTGDIIPMYHPDTGELVQFDRINNRDVKKALATFGIGLGITHPITQNFGTELGLKLNSNINEKYNILFGGRGTYITIFWGFVFYVS